MSRVCSLVVRAAERRIAAFRVGHWPGRVVMLAMVAVLMAGCNPFAEPDSLFDTYVTRLARVLDTEAPSRNEFAAPALPRLRERVRHIAPLDLGLLDFLGLYGCDLQHVIGERNSSLGRVMHPASVLDYELRFLVEAERCLQGLDSPERRARLQDVIASKRATLLDAQWNAVWANREIETLFTRSRGALPVGGSREQVGAIGADLERLLHVFERVAGGELTQDFSTFDPMLQRWQASPLVGQSLRAAVLAGAELTRASVLLEARLGERPLCHKGHRNRQAETLHSMFLSVYIGQVQPYLADLQRARQALLPPLAELASLGGQSGSQMQHFVAAAIAQHGDESVWWQLDQALQRHTHAWQQLLEQCGMRPGQVADEVAG